MSGERRIRQLGHLLTDVVQVVEPRQWRRVARLGKVGRIMDALEQEPAWWSPDHPAINPYQRRRIAAGEFNSYRDLDRELRVNNFLLLEELGRGGMGYVHKAWSINFGKLVAVKRTEAGHHMNRDRLEREARILQLLDDPVIAQYVSWEPVEDGGGFLLAMEFVPGQTLRDYLSRQPQIGVEKTVQWGESLLQALRHAHSRHVIHRDITPRNIMVLEGAESDAVKLLDFGLGKIRDGISAALNVPDMNFDLTQDNQALGTPQYMSPELWRDAATVTGASDIYSLGCNLYEMLAGRTPFADTEGPAVCIRHLDHPPPDIRLFRSDTPEHLRDAIHQMLEKEPNRRGTIEELIARLRPSRRLFSSGPDDNQTFDQSGGGSAQATATATSVESLDAQPEPAAVAPVNLSPEPSRLPGSADWKRRLFPQSRLSAAARCVEPTISPVEIYEQIMSKAWALLVIALLLAFCFVWSMMD